MDYRSTPSVQIDLDVVERNIVSGVQALASYGIVHRPHIKAHKCAELARLQIKLGCKGITCAKLGEAEVMADAGIDDILLAYPLIGKDKLERYRLLVERGIHIRTLINSLPGAKGLSDLGLCMGRCLPVLVELDGGINRGGVKMGALLDEFVKEVMRLPGIVIEGIVYYGGDIYGCKTEDDIRKRARRERDEIVQSAGQISTLGLEVKVLSGGSSFALHFAQELEGITEVRAGNYIFNDNALFTIGVIKEEECALRIYSTVVSRPDAHSAILDAGSKTLTSDTVGCRKGYGYIVGAPDAIIHKLNEEHGYVFCEREIQWEIGQVVAIIPNHACTVPNLCDELYGIRRNRLDKCLRVDARGKNR